MIKHFTTNGRLVSDLLASYPNTFSALRELINNSIQAKATEIRVNINQYGLDEVTPTPFIDLSIMDNGEGVHFDDIDKKILDIATDDKINGKGIGRFASFQIGKDVLIETVGEKNGKKTKTSLKIDCKKIEKSKINDYPVEIQSEETDLNTYYKVEITNLYNVEEIDVNPRRKICKELLLDNIYRELFLFYSNSIINSKIKIIVNNREVKTEDFLLNEVEYKNFDYNRKGKSAKINLTVIHYVSNKPIIRIAYRTENGGVLEQVIDEVIRLDIPDENGWEIFVDSVYLNENPGVYRNFSIARLDEEVTDFKLATKQEIKQFFQKKFSDYYDFSKKLKNDEYYPFKKRVISSSSQAVAFSQIAYCLEEEYKLLGKSIQARKVIYPLVDLAITNGDLSVVLSYITNLNTQTITRFKELIEKVDLDNVIEFSNDIVNKGSFLDLLNELIYSDISKRVKERSQLHKILEKQLWIFGEQYVHSPKLFSDKNLENNLTELRKKYFSYDPLILDDNLIEISDEKILDITDLFFYNEKILSDVKREIMIVELKAPRCAISQKELSQVDRYLFDIEQKGVFSKDLSYKIILVSSKLTDFTKSKIGQLDINDRHLYTRSKVADITIYVYEWSDIIAENRRKLSFLGNVLRAQDTDIRNMIQNDYPEYGLEQFLPTIVEELS